MPTSSWLPLPLPWRFAAEWALDCLKVLLETNMQQNLQIVVNVAKEYTEQVPGGREGRRRQAGRQAVRPARRVCCQRRALQGAHRVHIMGSMCTSQGTNGCSRNSCRERTPL